MLPLLPLLLFLSIASFALPASPPAPSLPCFNSQNEKIFTAHLHSTLLILDGRLVKFCYNPDDRALTSTHVSELVMSMNVNGDANVHVHDHIFESAMARALQKTNAPEGIVCQHLAEDLSTETKKPLSARLLPRAEGELIVGFPSFLVAEEGEAGVDAAARLCRCGKTS